ncbi:MAG TPA: hypothetical protein PKH77_16485 [Anaerolineae bacterium]|nr:hypothetical protein [Anaerolineae bacterium]
MLIQITDEVHNRVDWAARTPLIKILLGLLLGWGLLIALLLPTPGKMGIAISLTASILLLLIALILALTTPLSERGRLERTLDGGELYRHKRWLLLGRRVAWQAPLEDISGFQMERQTFEETAAHTYTLARLWAVQTDGNTALLTDWAEPDAVRTLGESLAKAGRRIFEEA